MNIGEIIQSIFGPNNPEFAMMAAQQNGAPGVPAAPVAPAGATEAGGPPPQGIPDTAPGRVEQAVATTSQAASTAPVAPMPEQPLPTAYQSPPDLSKMYLDMIQKTQARQQLNAGLGMMAAAFAQDQNRAAILSATRGGGGGGGSDIINTISNIQKGQLEMRQKAALRAQLPMIAKQYGLSLPEVQMMFEGGQLEEFIKGEATRQRNPETQVFTRADGSTYLGDSNTGAPIQDIAGPAKRDIIQIDNPDGKGGKISVYKDTMEPITGGAPVTSIAAPERKIEYIDDPSGKGGKIAVYAGTTERVDGGPAVTSIAAPPKKIEYLSGPNGSQFAVDDQTGERIPDKDIPGIDQIEILTLGDGTKQAYNKTKNVPVGDPFGAPSDARTDDMKEYSAWAMARKMRGEEVTPFDVWLDSREKTRGPKSMDGGKLGEQTAKNYADVLKEDMMSGKEAVKVIESVQTARKQFKQGIVAGSSLSPTELEGRKVLSDIFGMGDTSKIANTEAFLASMKEVVLNKIKALGSGTAISDADRRYIDEAVGGNITLNEQSISRILDIIENAARVKIRSYNKGAGELINSYDDENQRKEMRRSLPELAEPSAEEESLDDLLKRYE